MSTPEQAPRYPTSPCKACHAPLIWARNVKTSANVALDVEPVDPNTGGGDVKIDRYPGSPTILATVEPNAAARFGWRFVYRRHMTTCPRRKMFNPHQP